MRVRILKYVVPFILVSGFFLIGLYFWPVRVNRNIKMSDYEGNTIEVEFDYTFHKRIPEKYSFYSGKVTVDDVVFFSLWDTNGYRVCDVGSSFYESNKYLVKAKKITVVGGFEKDSDYICVSIPEGEEYHSYYYKRTD